MTIESVIREQRQVIETLWARPAGGPPREAEVARQLHERLAVLGEALANRDRDQLAAAEHALVEALLATVSVLIDESGEQHLAQRQALDALEQAAKAAIDEDPGTGIKMCLDAVRSAFGPAANTAVLLFDSGDRVIERAYSGDFGTLPLDELGREVSHAKEVVEFPRNGFPLHVLARSLPLANERRGVLFLAIDRRPSGAVRRLLETVADRLAHVVDLLDRQQLASAELERMGEERALRERFVAILAHDLRGPLMAARISVECLLTGLTRPDLIHCARRVVHSIARADGMMRDLLDASRVRAGQPLPLDLGACELAALVGEVVDDLALQYGPRFLVRVDPGIHGVWCARELRRALWNLLTNAVRHGDPGRPIVVGGVVEGDRACVTVENQGPGIAPDALERIFDPYERRSGDGWGLGLTLVRACAEAHGGSVSVSSGEGTSTTFSIRLPFDAAPFYAELLSRAEAKEERSLGDY